MGAGTGHVLVGGWPAFGFSVKNAKASLDNQCRLLNMTSWKPSLL